MENRIFISPKQDIMFKKVFGSNDSKRILKSLLSSITGIPEDSFNELTVEDPNLNPNRKEGKKSIVDVRVRLTDDTEVIFEMQREYHKGFEERVLHSSSKTYSESLDSGNDYSKIPLVITIVFADFPHYPNEDVYHHKMVTGDIKTGILFSDRKVIHFIELPKIPKRVNLWYDFLNSVNWEKLEMVAEENDVVKEAVTKVRLFSEEESVRWQAFREKQEERVYNQMLKDASELGHAEGHSKGHLEGTTDVARNMLTSGMDFETVSKLTGLSRHQLIQISDYLNKQ